jgi:hypothetical protein
VSIPPHARQLLDDLFGARDTIDTLIAGIERFYDVQAVESRPRAVKAPKLTQPEATPWVAPPAIVEREGIEAVNGHAALEVPEPTPDPPGPVVDRGSLRYRQEAILHAIRLGPPVGLSCADIVQALYPGVRGDERKKLTTTFWTTLQAMTKSGVLVEDSRLYTLVRMENGGAP